MPLFQLKFEFATKRQHTPDTLAASFFGQMRALFIPIIFAGLWSCSKTSNSKSGDTHVDSLAVVNSNSSKGDMTATPEIDYESLFKLESYLTNNVTVDTSLQIIDYDCAILIYPNDKQIEEMKKTEGEENFYTAADDANWYQGLAIGTMDSVGVKQISASGQFLRLRGKSRTWDLDVRKKNFPPWNLIFFKRDKEPEIISTVDLTTQKVKEYFEIAR